MTNAAEQQDNSQIYEGESLGIEFEDLFDIDEIQRIQDEFAEATGVASLITRPDGQPITKPSNFTTLCQNIIRKTELGCANCYKSDATIGRFHPDGSIVQTCMSGGLWDAGASITVGNYHVANWLIGQVRDETQTTEKMLSYATLIGVDVPTFIKAFEAVPAMSRERFGRIAKALFSIANQLAAKAYLNIKQQRTIVELEATQKNLRESEAYNKALFADSRNATVVLDPLTGRFIDCNDAARLLYQLPNRDAVIGLTPLDVAAPMQYGGIDSASAVRQRVNDAIGDGSTLFEFRHKRPNGEEWDAEVHLMKFQYGERTLLQFSLQDITARKAAEAEVHRLNGDLERRIQARTAELEFANTSLSDAKHQAEAASIAKTAFLANMSHEIRTPLNAVTGMVHMLRRTEVTPDQADKLNKINAAGEHLLDVINAILDLSKIEAGKFSLEETLLRPERLIENVSSIVKERVLAKGLRWEVVAAAFPPNLLGDPTRIQQALLNYATNAIKFTQVGGVTLRAILLGDDENTAHIRFEVEDTGIGIPVDAQARLFSSFEQADNSTTRKYGGTGLGLAITKKLSQLMGGDTGMSSTVGTGSLFWFSVRLKKGNPVAPEVEAVRIEDPSIQIKRDHGGRRLLLAEDEPINREIAIMLLTDVGLNVDVAEDGIQVTDLARENDYALILMDIQMPERDGLEATRQIRQIPDRMNVPIIAMTAGAFAEERDRCFAAGMNGFLPKPVNPDDLYSTILSWLRR